MSTTPASATSSVTFHHRVAGLAERAARAFAPQACLRGYAAFVRGGVAVERLDADRAALLVRGQRSRSVDVRSASGALLVSCTCAPTSLPLAPCRHLWAALLELDKQQAFPDLRATRGALRVEMRAPPAPEPEREAKPTSDAKPKRKPKPDAKAEAKVTVKVKRKVHGEAARKPERTVKPKAARAASRAPRAARAARAAR